MDFSFIGDDHFRESLSNDFRELESCAAAECWKAVHVLAGSIIEALLIDFLHVSKKKFHGKDALRLDLGEAIEGCLTEGLLRKETASLCDVIRDYRNLIHPGRMKRLEQSITSESGRIAINLIALVSREIAEQRKRSYGPTAEQLLKKIRTDQYSMVVMPQLVSETNEHERVKLISELIPHQYTIEQNSDFTYDDGLLNRLRLCYRQVFDTLSVQDRQKVALKFPRMIREESAEKIESYGDAFFQAADVSLLSPPDAAITLKHLFGRLEQPIKDFPDGLLRVMVGLGAFVDKSNASKSADALVRLLVRASESSSKAALSLANQIYDSANNETQSIFEQRLEHWKEMSIRSSWSQTYKDRLFKLEEYWSQIPF